MSGDDQVNATTLLQGSRMLFLTQDGNQSVGLNSYVDAPTNAVMGLVIFDELNDPPNQTRISINNQGITETFANGSPDLNVSWSNFYLLKEATQALRLPITANILVANDTIEANDNNLAKTRIASLSADPSLDPTLILKKDVGGVSWEEVDITPTGVQYIDSGGTPSNQTWANIIGGVSSIGLGGVLTNSNNAGGQNISNVNDIQLSSINSSSYPPPITADLSTILANGNSAGGYDINMNSQNINSVNNINLGTINGLPPTTIGLTWGSLTGGNAYSNLPNQAYEVQTGNEYTSQKYNLLQVYNGNYPQYANYTSNGMDLIDINSSTTTSYSSNNINIQNGTAFTITQQSGQNINLNCGQLVINGTPYSPSVPPPLRWGYYNNTGTSFSISSGSWYNVGVGSSPIITLSGMGAGSSYTIGIQFTCWTDSAENTGACYLGYSNSYGGFNSNCLYTSGRPCPAITNNTTFSSSSNTQFTIQDTLIFTAGSSGELYIDLYLGHNGGSWSGNYYWSFSANILTP